MEDSYGSSIDMAATNVDKENDSVLLGGRRDDTDDKLTERNVETTVVSDNWKMEEKEKAPVSERESSGQDEKDTKHAVLTPKETVTVSKKTEVKESEVGTEQTHVSI